MLWCLQLSLWHTAACVLVNNVGPRALPGLPGAHPRAHLLRLLPPGAGGGGQRRLPQPAALRAATAAGPGGWPGPVPAGVRACPFSACVPWFLAGIPGCSVACSGEVRRPTGGLAWACPCRCALHGWDVVEPSGTEQAHACTQACIALDHVFRAPLNFGRYIRRQNPPPAPPLWQPARAPTSWPGGRCRQPGSTQWQMSQRRQTPFSPASVL